MFRTISNKVWRVSYSLELLLNQELHINNSEIYIDFFLFTAFLRFDRQYKIGIGFNIGTEVVLFEGFFLASHFIPHRSGYIEKENLEIRNSIFYFPYNPPDIATKQPGKAWIYFFF